MTDAELDWLPYKVIPYHRVGDRRQKALEQPNRDGLMLRKRGRGAALRCRRCHVWARQLSVLRATQRRCSHLVEHGVSRIASGNAAAAAAYSAASGGFSTVPS
jgi:hypothetical protein